MESVFVFMPRDRSFDAFLPLLDPLGRVTSIVDLDVPEIQVHTDETWLQFQLHEDWSILYDEAEPEDIDVLAMVREHLDSASFVLVSISYSSVELLKSALRIILTEVPSVIDNDHGTILPGDSFVALLDGRPDWNWQVEAFEDLVRRGLI